MNVTRQRAYVAGRLVDVTKRLVTQKGGGGRVTTRNLKVLRVDEPDEGLHLVPRVLVIGLRLHARDGGVEFGSLPCGHFPPLLLVQ